jgi:hypothetical protein
MDERRGGLRRPSYELKRVAGIDLDAVVVAPKEPDSLSVEDVDGGEDCKIACHRATMLTR